MTVPTDLRRCVGWFTCDSAGYDAGNARLIDQSGLGFHFPLVSGAAPPFIARSGVNCIDLDNTFYFERYNLIPVHGSVVIKFHTDSTGSINNVLAMLYWRQTTWSTGDHVALTPKEPWDAYDGRALSWFSPSGGFVRTGSYKGGTPTASSAPAALNTWHVATAAWNTQLQGKIKVGTAATVTTTISPVPAAPPQFEEDTMRFGYLKVTGTVSFPPQHLAVAQFAFFHDDILANQPTEAAALVASWS